MATATQKDIDILTNALPMRYNDLHDPAMKHLLNHNNNPVFQSWCEEATDDDSMKGDGDSNSTDDGSMKGDGDDNSTDGDNGIVRKTELFIVNSLQMNPGWRWVSEEEVISGKNQYGASEKQYLFGNLTDYLRTKVISSSSTVEHSGILILWHPRKVKVTAPLGKKKLSSQEEIAVSVPFFMATIIPMLFDRFVVSQDEYFAESWDIDDKINDSKAIVSLLETVAIQNLQALMNSHESNFPEDISTEEKNSIVSYFKKEDKNSQGGNNGHTIFVNVHPMSKVFEGLSNELLAYIFHEHVYKDGGCVLCPNGYNKITKSKDGNGDTVLNLDGEGWHCG